MQQQLFHADSKDYGGDCFIYEGVDLLVDIGPHKAGKIFDGACIGMGYIELFNYNSDGSYSHYYKYELSYKVGKKIPGYRAKNKNCS